MVRVAGCGSLLFVAPLGPYHSFIHHSFTGYEGPSVGRRWLLFGVPTSLLSGLKTKITECQFSLLIVVSLLSLATRTVIM